MQQRKMIRAELQDQPASHSESLELARRHHSTVDAGLIVPRDTSLTREAKYTELTRRRHRAQVAARRALAATLLDCAG